MIRVDIETIIMASGPVPSVIVLRERGNGESANAPSRSLSIQTGSVEAAAISRGIDNSQNNGRPITHDLFIETLRQLNVKLERVEINRVDAPVFFARLVLVREGADKQIEELKARGMQVNDVDKEAFIKRVKPIWDRFNKEHGPEWVDLALKSQE